MLAGRRMEDCMVKRSGPSGGPTARSALEAMNLIEGCTLSALMLDRGVTEIEQYDLLEPLVLHLRDEVLSELEPP